MTATPKRKSKIPVAVRISWLIASTVGDFVTAPFLMMLLGSLGHHWGYWHSWWVTSLSTAVSSAFFWPILVRQEFQIDLD